MDSWTLPDRLAKEALDRLEIAPPIDRAGVDELVEALGRRLPRGSTAKLAAIAEGRRPAGHDPAEVVEGWLADRRVAWTCWAAATVTAALVRAGGVIDAEVMGVRRCGNDAPPVDFHSVVGIVDGDRRWVCDPHFGVGTVPGDGGERMRPALQGSLRCRPDGRFDWTVSGPSFSVAELPYRSLTGPLDSADVRAFCDVSVTHSGVRNYPFSLLLLPDGVGSLRAEGFDTPPERRLWRTESDSVGAAQTGLIEPEQRMYATWDEGMGALLAAGERPT